MKQIIYSDKYEVDIGSHVFPTKKYRLIKERLIKEKNLHQSNFIQPPLASDEELLLVHTREYIEKIKEGSLSISEMFTLELPYSPQLKEASLITVGGTILACRNALEFGVGIHLGGGFHHAFADHGEGFCVFNDIACGIRKLQKEHKVKKALIIDCDLHQGNGTADIFSNDEDVFTFSIHQQNIYPTVKPPSNLDIGLEEGTQDKQYLKALKDNIPKIIRFFNPEFILYVAGADPYEKDQLGSLLITKEGLKKRDEFIISLIRENNIPLSIVLAGGYAIDLNDTVDIHFTTISLAL